MIHLFTHPSVINEELSTCQVVKIKVQFLLSQSLKYDKEGHILCKIKHETCERSGAGCSGV